MTLRQDLLAVLQDAEEPLTVDRLAAATGRPATTVRFHLDRLLRDDAIVAAPVGSPGPGRPRLAYTAHGRMDPTGARDFDLLAQALAAALADDPDGPRKATAAGAVLGADRADPAADPLDDLLDVLMEAGFSPAVSGGDRIRLRRCPFLEAARAHPAVTCAVHRGLMQGVLDAPRTGTTGGAGWQLAALEAFVDGDHCVARVRRPAHRAELRAP
ncbi:transcriptional regulator [Gordonia alkaliphila]|uniref:transcriptional regulator n=1 Tax=Gordonia alkaliphila TaxID=1053547 RepID=UPI001FF5B9FA|nr:transcriptional regulator [Gordonia alkaliphila]MCK0439566.1 transcriptional regulator [Gordonia alkaliphila]